MDVANSHNSGVFKRSKVKKKKLKNILRLELHGGSVGVLKTEANLSQQHGASTSEKLATRTPFIVANKPEIIGKTTDTIKIEPAGAQSYEKPCKKKGKSPRLKPRAVINKSSAESLVGLGCFGEISMKGRKNNRIKRTKCTINEYSQNNSVSKVKDSFSNIPNGKNVYQTFQKPKLRSNNEGKHRLNYSVNSNSSNKALKRNAKKVVRKDSVETSNLNSDSCMIENYDLTCSAENDVPLKFLSNVTIQTSSTDVDQKPHREGKLNVKNIHGINDCNISRLKKPLPMCIEMGGEDCIPFKFFGERPTDVKSHSVKPIVSEDHELFCGKLKDLSKIGTENWEINIVDIYSSTFNKDTENNDHASSNNNITENNDHEQKQEEVQDLQYLQEDVTVEYGGTYKKKHRKRVFRTFQHENQRLLILSPGGRVNLKGILKLTILLGSIKVLGYEMREGDTDTVYSPFGFTFLKLLNNYDVSDDRQEHVRCFHRIRRRFNIKKSRLGNLTSRSTVILLENAAHSFIHTFSKYVREPIFELNWDQTGSVTIGITTDIVKSRTSYSKEIDENAVMYGKDKLCREEEWEVIAKQLAEFGECNPGGLRFAVFGGKGVGKSTFLRFMVNQMLTRKQKVLYIDLDPGQCEFTTPGCLSATVIEKPLLGPNFTHISQPDRCVYFGEVSVTNRVTAYLECVKFIHDWCSSEEYLSHIPWCINTMGFPRGFGVEIAHYTINLFKPSHVVQIISGWMPNNFECLLNSDTIKGMEIQHIHFEKNWDPQYHFYSIKSAVEMENEEDSIKTWPPFVLRNFTIVAYFNSAMLDSNSLLNVVPHVIRFEDVKLCVCHENIHYSDYLNAMNANLVGLCNVGSGKGLMPSEPGYPEIWTGRPLGPCYGMGIIRGVDMDEKVIFLVTPLSSEELDDVNCLVLGAVSMPWSMIFAQEEAEGEIPYVMKGSHPVLHEQGIRRKEWDA